MRWVERNLTPIPGGCGHLLTGSFEGLLVAISLAPALHGWRGRARASLPSKWRLTQLFLCGWLEQEGRRPSQLAGNDLKCITSPMCLLLALVRNPKGRRGYSWSILQLPINCHGVDVIKDPLMWPILGHLQLGVAKEFSLDPWQNILRSSTNPKVCYIILKRNQGQLLPFLILLTKRTRCTVNNGAEKAGRKADSGLHTQVLQDSQLTPELGSAVPIYCPSCQTRFSFDVFCLGFIILWYWEQYKVYLKATWRWRKSCNMENPRKVPAIK